MNDNKTKILVIDDETNIRRVLTTHLQRAGYQTVEAADGLEGLRHFYSDQPDLVILDVAMPSMDGWQVLNRLREVSTVPVLMLTAAGQDQDKIRGLDGGADDYITKPCSGEEFLARVKAVLRRTFLNLQVPAGDVYRDSEVVLDHPHHSVTVRGNQVELSPTEFRLLGVLTDNAGVVLSQDQLLDQAWDQSYGETGYVVRLYIGHLRKKIEVDPSSPKLIQTVRGFGYRYQKPEA
ncbi:MAG: response regulator transcription factor [SAR202 cluster bacterium]|nr:response regulator transcription factor [SAR202 cluster bacterium]